MVEQVIRNFAKNCIISLMYNDEKIGVGIITCNRKDQCKLLFESVDRNRDVDLIVIVKDRDFDYGSFIDEAKASQKTSYVNVLESKGVGHCKNEAFKLLIKNGCQHIFLIEDDTSIKRDDVFKRYIDTAKSFNIEHLSYGGCSPFQSWRKPICQVSNGKEKIDFYHHIKGEFCYYTANALQMVGLMDEMYVNAVEHIEHTYRLMKFGYTCGCFWAFPDIASSEEYLYNTSCENGNYATTMDTRSEKYKIDAQNAHKHFYDVYGKTFAQFPMPNKQMIEDSFRRR